MSKRSVAVSVVIVSMFLGFLSWLFREGAIGLAGIGIIVVAGFAFAAVIRYFYGRLWRDDES